jgi:hypothetical protein
VFLNKIECGQAVQCKNNQCVIRRVQVLGLDPLKPKSEWDLDKKFGKVSLPILTFVADGLSVNLNCESFV